MDWKEVMKSGGLYHPISYDYGYFVEIRFIDDELNLMGDQIILHLKFRNWSSLDPYKDFNGGRIAEIHLSISPTLQGKGVAEKAIVGAILDKEEVLDYRPFLLNYRRITNDRVFSVVEKLKKNSLVKTTEITNDENKPIGLMVERK